MDMHTRLKNRRLELGWTPKEAAYRIGVSEQFVGQVEDGKKKPGRRSIGRWASAYNVSVDWILELPNAETPKSPPKGNGEILEHFNTLSRRGRQELIAITEALAKLDQDWQQYEMIITALEALQQFDLIDDLIDGKTVVPNGFILDGVTIKVDTAAKAIRIVPLEN